MDSAALAFDFSFDAFCCGKRKSESQRTFPWKKRVDVSTESWSSRFRPSELSNWRLWFLVSIHFQKPRRRLQSLRKFLRLLALHHTSLSWVSMRTHVSQLIGFRRPQIFWLAHTHRSPTSMYAPASGSNTHRSPARLQRLSKRVETTQRISFSRLRLNILKL